MFRFGTSSARATINAPIEAINLGEWMFTLTSEEYAACSTAHQSAAQGVMPNGKRLSINVETIGGDQMVQHYIETIAQPDHVLGVSPNSLLWLNGYLYLKLAVRWDLKVEQITDSSCELVCTVTPTSWNPLKAIGGHAWMLLRGRPVQPHIDEETPLFARDIERKALAGVWAHDPDSVRKVEHG